MKKTNLVFFDSYEYSVQPSYIYGTPYLGTTTAGAATAGATTGYPGLPIPATQLSHAAAIAAATNQFYEYQVCLRFESCSPAIESILIHYMFYSPNRML